MRVRASLALVFVPGLLLLGMVGAVEAKDQKLQLISKIGSGDIGYGSKGEWRASREWATFTVPQNGQALGFASQLREFTIYSIDANGKEVDYFRRSIRKEWDQRTSRFRDVGTQDTPVPLGQLTLGPGKYTFAIPGKPGDSGSLSLTIRTPGP